jgi:hypothetical protein
MRTSSVFFAHKLIRVRISHFEYFDPSLFVTGIDGWLKGIDALALGTGTTLRRVAFLAGSQGFHPRFTSGSLPIPRLRPWVGS